MFVATRAEAQPPSSGDFRVQVDVASPMSPWKMVRYVLRERSGRATVSVSKSYRTDTPKAQKLGIVPAAQLPELLGKLEQCNIETLPSAKSKAGPSSATWTFHVARDGRNRSFTVVDPAQQPDPRYFRCAAAMRTAAATFAGAIPFRHVDMTEGAYGYLHVSSQPTGARLFLDGKDTGELTPTANMIVGVGKHDIVLVVDGTDIKESYDVTILPSVTTNLDLELR